MADSDPRIKGEPLARCPGTSVRDLALADTNPVPEFLYTDEYETLGSDPIPASRYTDPAFFEQEKQRMWPRVWQFAFHNVRDIPEMLISGREKAYFSSFFTARLHDVDAVTEDDIDQYAATYAAPGALRVGLKLYRGPSIATSPTTGNRWSNAQSGNQFRRCNLPGLCFAPSGLRC